METIHTLEQRQFDWIDGESHNGNSTKLVGTKRKYTTSIWERIRVRYMTIYGN